MRDLFDGVAERHGRVDIAFNNAGISPPDDDSILDTGLDAWDRVHAGQHHERLPLLQVRDPAHAAAGQGLDHQHGASFVALMGAATSQIAYTASKGGVLAMTRELGVQFAREGIRVNALCPGPVATPLLHGAVRQGPGAGRPPAGARADGPVRRARRRSPPRSRSWPATTPRSSPPSQFLVDGGITGAYVTPL